MPTMYRLSDVVVCHIMVVYSYGGYNTMEDLMIQALLKHNEELRAELDRAKEVIKLLVNELDVPRQAE